MHAKNSILGVLGRDNRTQRHRTKYYGRMQGIDLKITQQHEAKHESYYGGTTCGLAFEDSNPAMFHVFGNNGP